MHRTIALFILALLAPSAHASDAETPYGLIEEDDSGDVGLRYGGDPPADLEHDALDLTGFSLGNDAGALLFRLEVRDLDHGLNYADSAVYYVHWTQDDVPLRLEVQRIVPVTGAEPNYSWSLYQNFGEYGVYAALLREQTVAVDPDAGLLSVRLPFDELPARPALLEDLHLTTGPGVEALATVPSLVGPETLPYLGDRLPDAGVLEYAVMAPVSVVANGVEVVPAPEPVADAGRDAPSLPAWALLGALAAAFALRRR